MSKTDWINWSSVARRAFAEALNDIEELESKKRLERFTEIVSKSKLTEEDAMRLAKGVNAGMYLKLKKLHPELR